MKSPDLTEVAELREQLQLQVLISEVSALLMNADEKEIDARIEEALQRITEFLGVDRCSFGEYTDDRKAFLITHSYAVPGIERVPRKSLIELLPWLARKTRNGEVVRLETPADLPEEATAERASWSRTGQKSGLAIPVTIGGSILCGIGMGCFRAHRSWPDPLVQQLKGVGEVFAHAVYRKRSERLLLKQYEFEQLISNLSARLVNAAPDQLNREVEDSLEHLLRMFEFDRCALLQVSRDEKQAIVTHSFNGEGIAAAPTTINYVEHFPWHAKKLLAGEEVLIHTRNLPPEGDIDRRSSEQMGILSNLVVPIMANGILEYVFAGNAVRKEIRWPQEVVPRMRLLGEIIMGALSRNRAQQALEAVNKRLAAEADYLRSEVQLAYHYENIIGESAAIRKVLRQVEQVAGTDSTVLLLGETGTGKELVARAIHNQSRRKDRAMVRVNCASLPATLIENELFGREKGAYTGALTKQIGRFEIADGSTIFLDEIGELPLDLQTKLLRVLQEKEFERLGSTHTVKIDVRVIAATNRNLSEAVKKGLFRQDLYYRLNVFPIVTPPLRERPEDIPLLVMAFLNEFKGKIGKSVDAVSKQSMDSLLGYSWPGNIRELRNVVEHGLITSTGSVLQLQSPQGDGSETSEGVTLDEMQRQHIRDVIKKAGGRIKGPNGAARVLGLKPSTLYNKLKRLGITPRSEEDPN